MGITEARGYVGENEEIGGRGIGKEKREREGEREGILEGGGIQCIIRYM